MKIVWGIVIGILIYIYMCLIPIPFRSDYYEVCGDMVNPSPNDICVMIDKRDI